MNKAGIDAIDEEIRSLISQESRLKEGFARMQIELGRVQTERKVLEGLRDRLAKEVQQDDPQPTQFDTNGQNGDANHLAPTAMILLLLRQRPMTTKALADWMEGRVDSQAKNVRRNILSCLHQLRIKGRVVIDDEGRNCLAPPLASAESAKTPQPQRVEFGGHQN
jgi:hypothetical protein